MATAVLTNVPTVIDSAEAVTNWGGDTFATDADIKVQGNSSVSCTFTPSANSTQEVYVTGSWNFTTAVHLRLWMNNSIASYTNTKALDGIQLFLYDGTNTDYWTVSGSDFYGGGWEQFLVYTGTTPTEDNGANHAAVTRIGIRISVHTRPRNAVNMWLDAWNYGDGYTVTGGTSGDEIDWSHIAAVDKTNAYGVVTVFQDVYFLSGAVAIGSGATTTFFKSGQKIQFVDLPVLSTLYDITFSGSACNVDIAGGSYGAAALQDYTFDSSDTNLNAYSLSGVQFSNAGLISFEAGSTISTSVFDNCGQVDPSTSSFTGVIFSNYVGTTGALLFPTTDATISGLEFINCDNGVEYDAASDITSPAFDDFTFDDEAGNYDVNNTSGAAVSISKNNGSNPNSYNPAGDIVTFLGASVQTKIVAKDADTGGFIQNARVLGWVTSGVNFPYQASVTITGSGTTATVTHTAHGISTGDTMWITGADQENYSGAYDVTVTGVDTYTYTTAETVITSPATGTITSTFCFFNTLTDINGEVLDSRVIDNDQPFNYRVRKSTTPPLYRQGTGSETTTSLNGISISVNLVSDE